ncbi:MAG TPA: hypothetical protein VJK09_00920 [Candidatus Paceibacterota bacterium]
MSKTNKSFSKRMKITKRGQILVRKAGQNHFNAKASRNKQMSGKHWNNLKLNAKTISRNLPNL